jgi:hypothetical protein
MPLELFVNIRSLTLLPLSLAILNVSACAFKEDTPEQPKVSEAKPSDIVDTIERGREQQATDIKLTNENVKIRFDELPDPNAYRVVITWPANIKRMQIVRAKDARPTIVAGQNEFSEHVRGGETVSYGLLVQDSFGAHLQALNLEAVAPVDLELRKRKDLAEDTLVRVNRVFFNGGGFVTNGFNLTIETNSLIIPEEIGFPRAPTPIDGAHVLTVFPGTQIDGNQMSAGSKIRITAKFATGKMILGLIGANGKPGRSGQELESQQSPHKRNSPDPNRKGANGLDAISVLTQRPCAPLNNGLDISCDIPTPKCERQPTNGENGLIGEVGYNGEQGERGGNTGSIHFFIQDHSQFTADILFRKGKRGDGGAPGPGFPGGKGGTAGKTAAACGTAVDGADGPVGPSGKPGEPGLNGDLGPFNGNGVSIRLDEY